MRKLSSSNDVLTELSFASEEISTDNDGQWESDFDDKNAMASLPHQVVSIYAKHM